MSMVEMMMAGVVRKKSKMKRMQLMMKQRIHQEIPPSDRCSLQERATTSADPNRLRLVWEWKAGVCTYQRTFCGSGAYETLQL